jgi:uncharacterized protein with HEPN domain
MEKNTRTDALYLEDMIAAIEKVLEYTDDYDYIKFDADDLVKDAVLLNMQRIGEGANRISLKNKEKYPQIPWREMANFRIIVSHIYFKMDYSIVWDTIKLNLEGDLKDLKNILVEVKQKENKSI